MFVKDLDSLKYSELQKLAKSAGIKANQKVDKLMTALKEHYLEAEDSQDDRCTDVTSIDKTPEKLETTTGQGYLPRKNSEKTIGNKCESGSESEELIQDLAANPVLEAVPRHTVNNTRQKTIVGKVSSRSVPVRSSLLSPLRKMADSLAALRKATPSTSSSAKKSVETLPGSSVSAAITPDSKLIKKRRRTFDLDEPTLSAQNTPVLEDQSERKSTRQRTSQGDVQSVAQQEEPTKKRVRKNTYGVEASSPDGVSATPSTSTSAKKSVETLPGSSVSAAITPDSKLIKKRRRTFDLDEPTLSAQNTPVLEDQSERKSTRQRTSQGDVQSVAQQEELTKKHVRKNTYGVEASSPDGVSDGSAEQAAATSTSSPGTRAMIEDIDVNLPSAERKLKLLSALDKKIKNKAPSPAQQSSAAQSQPSQIPRFMAFLSNKKIESQKPVTPGNKDWTKIHSKEFSKFDSLDVYLERKQQRMDKLTGSAKRPITVTTRRQRAKIVKPVTRLQVPVSSVKPFVPVVTSTRNITFNFSKTPVALKTPGPAAAEASPTPRKQRIAASDNKSVGPGNRTTPFIFTGNNASHNTTVSSQKKTFDLKASLSKPLSWKPHTGRLQSLDVNKPQPTAHVVPVKQGRTSRQALASKSRPVNAKDIRRVQQLDRRNNQKYIDMMRRRGLMA